MDKRGQGATEYLIILAIAIIIALIVIAALGGVPSIGRSTTPRTGEAYWETAEVGVSSHALINDGSTDDFRIELKNNLDDSIRVTNIMIDSTTVDIDDMTLTPGQKYMFIDSSVGDKCENDNDAYSFTLKIEYTDLVTQGNYTFTGQEKIEGVCSANSD